MTSLTHLDANPRQATDPVVNADANRAGPESTSMNYAHRVGDTVDKVDQVSSVTLLGFAVVGSVVMLGAHWLVG